MCRSQMDQDSIVRLRISLSDKDPEYADAEREAESFMQSISDVANKGSSEEDLTLLIHDCKKFLHSVPRDKVCV